MAAVARERPQGVAKHWIIDADTHVTGPHDPWTKRARLAEGQGPPGEDAERRTLLGDRTGHLRQSPRLFHADIADPRKLFLFVVALHVLLLILFIMQPARQLMIALAAVLDLGIGGVLPSTQVLTAAVFGSATYGTVIGSGVVIHQLLTMETLRRVGEGRDRTGSYDITRHFHRICADRGGSRLAARRARQSLVSAPRACGSGRIAAADGVPLWQTGGPSAVDGDYDARDVGGKIGGEERG